MDPEFLLKDETDRASLLRELCETMESAKRDRERKSKEKCEEREARFARRIIAMKASEGPYYRMICTDEEFDELAATIQSRGFWTYDTFMRIGPKPTRWCEWLRWKFCLRSAIEFRMS